MIRGIILFELVLILFLKPAFAIESEIEQQAALNKLKEQIQQLQIHLNENQTAKDHLLSELKQTEIKIGQISREYYQLDIQLDQKQQQYRILEQQKTQQQQQIQQQQRLLEKQVKAAYIMGRKAKVKMILNQQEANPLARMMAYYHYLNQARIKQLQLLQEQFKILNTIRQKLLTESTALKQMQYQIGQKKQDQIQAMQQRQQVLADLEQDTQYSQQKLTELKQNEQHLLAILKTIRKALIDLPNKAILQQKFSQQKGRMHWPLEGKVLAAYGTPRSTNLIWDGYLIAAPEGHSIKAIYHGRIAYADWLRGFGLLIIIDHGDGYMSLYGHNQSIFKEVGEWINTDDIIGLSGKSGGQSKAGIYFSIRKKGKPINPKYWCKKIKDSRVS